MYNAGQTCCASKRFIVVEEIADKFLEKFKAALGALKPGDPMDEKTTHGPLSTESALVQLLKQVDAAVSKGAKVALGGKRIDRPGSFMQTTILTDVKPDNPAFRDEFFGPVAMLFRVKDEAAAIALANDSRLRFGWLGLYQGCSARQACRQPSRYRHDVHQQHRLVRRGASVRWYQGFRLRARARQHGDPGVCE